MMTPNEKMLGPYSPFPQQIFGSHVIDRAHPSVFAQRTMALHYIETMSFDRFCLLRNALLDVNMRLARSLSLAGLLVTSLVVRTLLYMLVVPTTMSRYALMEEQGG